MPVIIKTIVVGSLNTNCYLILDPGSRSATIIDPGGDADRLIKYLDHRRYRPDQIIATHGHADHLIAAGELQLHFNIPFLIHRQDEFLVKTTVASARQFGLKPPGSLPQISGYLKQDVPLTLSGQKCRVIHTPGHTPGGITLHLNSAHAAFVGDCLFAGGSIGRYDFDYSSAADLAHSLKKLLSLPASTIIYPGHGPASTISQAKNYFS